jgi:hypothetical protein
MRLPRLLLVLALLVCAGCAGLERRAFDKSAHGDLRTVGVLDTPPSQFRVTMLGHPGMMLGALGGLIAGGHMESNAQTFAGKMQELNFDPVKEFNDELAREIAGAGYAVKRIKTDRAQPVLMKSYATLDPAVDAYVDSVVQWSGYFSKTPMSGYLPAMRVVMRVVKRDGGQVAYEELISYGFDMTEDATNIPADPGVSFGTFDALVTDPQRAAAGIRAGIPKVVAQFIKDVSK